VSGCRIVSCLIAVRLLSVGVLFACRSVDVLSALAGACIWWGLSFLDWFALSLSDRIVCLMG